MSAELERLYGDDYIDVTERVTCYENGKTFDCDCGQGTGIGHEVQVWECPSCGLHCIDMKADERGPPETEPGQATLTDW